MTSRAECASGRGRGVTEQLRLGGLLASLTAFTRRDIGTRVRQPYEDGRVARGPRQPPTVGFLTRPAQGPQASPSAVHRGGGGWEGGAVRGRRRCCSGLLARLKALVRPSSAVRTREPL